MAVFQRANGSWSAQVYDPSSKRVVSVARWCNGKGTFDSEEKAKRAVTKATKAIALEGDSSRMSISDLHALWVADGEKRWKASTMAHYRDQTKAFVKAHGRRQVTGFKPEHAIRWNIEAPGTVPTVRNMFGWAVSSGLLTRNPWSSVERRKHRRQLEPGFLSEGDVDELANAADRLFMDFGPVAAAMILTSAWTCVRPSELFELRRKDLDLAAGELHVWRAVTASGGIDTTKKADVRQVILPEKAAKAIRRAMPIVEGLTGQSGPETLLFTNTRGTQWSQPGWQLKWQLIRAKVDRESLVYYDLRHFGATWLLEQGVSPQDVAVQMGHRDGGKLVMRVYGHPDLKFARARIKAAVDGAVKAAVALSADYQRVSAVSARNSPLARPTAVFAVALDEMEPARVAGQEHPFRSAAPFVVG